MTFVAIFFPRSACPDGRGGTGVYELRYIKQQEVRQ